MKLLLDTHIYLWWLIDDAELSRKARELIADANAVFVSAISIWEAGIKWQSGKLPVSPMDLYAGIVPNNFIELPVTMAHTLAAATLPPLHKDPFDRMLVAQAIAEPLHLLSTDKALAEYSYRVQIV